MYRAILKDNKVIIAKVSIFHPAGVRVSDHYGADAEVEHLNSIG